MPHPARAGADLGAADEARLRLASLEVVHADHGQALAAPLYFPSGAVE